VAVVVVVVVVVTMTMMMIATARCHHKRKTGTRQRSAITLHIPTCAGCVCCREQERAKLLYDILVMSERKTFSGSTVSLLT
jgi:hypothetical protein